MCKPGAPIHTPPPPPNPIYINPISSFSATIAPLFEQSLCEGCHLKCTRYLLLLGFVPCTWPALWPHDGHVLKPLCNAMQAPTAGPMQTHPNGEQSLARAPA